MKAVSPLPGLAHKKVFCINLHALPRSWLNAHSGLVSHKWKRIEL